MKDLVKDRFGLVLRNDAPDQSNKHQQAWKAALGDKLPHDTTLQKFGARSQVLAIADAMIRTLGRAAGSPEYAQGAAAMAATGLETTAASAHFQSRSGRPRHQWAKVSTIILCGSLPPLSLALDWEPGNDKCQAQALLAKASKATLPAKLVWRMRVMMRNERGLSETQRLWLAWAVESFFSGLKRTLGWTLNARKPSQWLAEAAFKVLAYTLRR